MLFFCLCGEDELTACFRKLMTVVPANLSKYRMNSGFFSCNPNMRSIGSRKALPKFLIAEWS